MAVSGFLGLPPCCGGGFGLFQFFLGGGRRLLGLRFLQAVGLLLVALLPRVSLRRLPEVGGKVNPPSVG